MTCRTLVVAMILALPCSVVRGQVAWATSREPFKFQVPAIPGGFNYPPELSSLEVEFKATVWVELGPFSISHEWRPIPAALVPRETVDYALWLAWTQLHQLSHPERSNPDHSLTLAERVSKWKVTVITEPVEDGHMNPVPALWSFSVLAHERGVWKPEWVRLLLLDQDGRIVFGEDRIPYGLYIGRGHVSPNRVAIDIITEIESTADDPSKRGRLIRYDYSQRTGELVASVLVPCPIYVQTYWDPLYKHLPLR
jgi:hypothetical protein